MSPSGIDLNEIANSKNLSLNISAEENPKDAFIRRIKDITLFFVSIIFAVSTFIFCSYIILAKNFSYDDKKWATAIGSSIVSAFIGFFTGKNSR